MQIINALVRHATERRSQDADESEPVVRITDGAKEIDGVDDFFGGVEMALSLDHVANLPAPKRLQIVIDIGELTEKNRNIFWLCSGPFAFLIDEANLVQQVVLEPRGETLAFEAASFLRVHFSRRRDDLAYRNWRQRLPPVGAAGSEFRCGAG